MARIDGTLLPETLDGTSSDDEIYGHGGNDLLRGYAGNDKLNGGGGDDTMEGGTGNDDYYVDVYVGDIVAYTPVFGLLGIPAIVLDVNADIARIQVVLGGLTQILDVSRALITSSDQVIEQAGEGFDTVHTGVSFSLAANQEVEQIVTLDAAGTREIRITGNEFAQSIYGNAGNNMIDGRGGNDYMVGLGGDDVYYVNSAGDQIGEVAGQGDDSVRASTDYTLRAGVSVETMTTVNQQSTVAINLTGNEIGNSLYGNNGVNVLNGGAGADYMVGLGGNDTFIIDNPGDRIAEFQDGGDDTAVCSVSYTLRAGVHVETMRTTLASATVEINLTGNEYGQSIYGNAAANLLNGGGGNDYLVGGDGDDILIGGLGVDVLVGGSGNDRFIFDSADLSADRILDFAVGDIIDLSAIDARLDLDGDQAFSFLKDGLFTGEAGQLRTVQGPNNSWSLEGDLNGDGVADLSLSITGATLGGGDLLF
jgi:Ca2+-binding RTX toxin-like protein